MFEKGVTRRRVGNGQRFLTPLLGGGGSNKRIDEVFQLTEELPVCVCVKVVWTVEQTGEEDAGELDRTPDVSGVRREVEGALTPIPVIQRECATNPRY
jgi:hypothetical protein